MDIHEFLETVAALFWPTRCAACGNRIPGDPKDLRFQGFCHHCAETFTFIETPWCPQCGIPYSGAGPNHTCLACSIAPPPYTRSRAALAYGGAIASAIQRFKYGNLPYIHVFLIPFLLGARSEFSTPDIVVPIPLYHRRLRKRGFNQSALLAKALARSMAAPINPSIMARVRDTPTQAGLSRERRQKNIAGAFVVKKPHLVFEKKILVVDDVITTAATTREAASTLLRAGAGSVEIIALARSVDSNY